MEKYVVVLHIPVEAVDAQAASLAQLQLFNQLRLVLAMGLRGSGYRVAPIPESDFAKVAVAGAVTQ